MPRKKGKKSKKPRKKGKKSKKPKKIFKKGKRMELKLNNKPVGNILQQKSIYLK